MSLLDSAIQIIESTANKLLPLLPFDSKSSNLLINEIIDEKDFIDKLSKLLHLLMDQITTQALKSFSPFDELVSDLVRFDPTIPRNPIDLSNWIKQKLNISTEKEFIFNEEEDFYFEKTDDCQKNISFDDKFIYSDEFEQHKNDFESICSEGDSMKMEIYSNKYFSNEIQERSNLIDDIQEQKAKIQALTDQIKCLQITIQEQESTIKALKSKISSDSKEISEIKKENEELFESYSNDSIFNVYNEELTEINEKLKNKIKKQKEKIILLRDKGNAKINKYKKIIEDQKMAIESLKISSNEPKSKYFINEELGYENSLDFSSDVANRNKELIECNGCDFNVSKLRNQFDDLEDSIDKLHSALTRHKPK